MEKLIRTLLYALIFFLVIFVGFYLFIFLALGDFFGPSYNKEDLIKNYENKKSAILAIKNYIDAKVPNKLQIDIEFEKGDIGRFHVTKDGNYETNWKPKSQKIDSLLKVIGWNQNDLTILKKKLDAANCISVASGNPIKIGWQRSGMGMYYYNIFAENLNDSLINQYNNGCTYIYYKNNVVLEYGGGAIGPNCF